MKISIRKPLGYSQIGRKDQQEDAVWPLFEDVSASNRCMVLCDGVGGSAHGEIASQTASKVIGEYLTSIAEEKPSVTESDVQDAVNLAYDELEKIDTETAAEGASISMATTLTCVCLHEDGVLAAHMGDSRIYLVRPGQGLLYQSSDHSLVNALLQAGELTLEEAKTFPRKNVITKAIQPHGKTRFKAEVHQLTDVQSGDYLFLCCDGVLEQLTNDRLVEILSMSCPDEEKIKLLQAESTDRTKDNYTAYLIPIESVEGVSSFVHNEEVAAVVNVENPIKKQPTPAPNAAPSPTIRPAAPLNRRDQMPAIQNNKDKKNNFLILALLAVAVISVFCFVFWSKSKKSNDIIDNNGKVNLTMPMAKDSAMKVNDSAVDLKIKTSSVNQVSSAESN